MSLEAVPELFSRVPGTLFSVLSGPSAPLYWAVLARFYQQEFEREPFHLVKPVALEIAENVLLESPTWLDARSKLFDEDETSGPSTADEPMGDQEALARATARRILDRLERTGWFHFEYRSTFGLVLNFYPYAARVLETLLRVARDEQPVFQGYAHSIASLLKPESFAGKPGVALLEAKRHTLEMVRELKILNRNIYAFTQRLIDEVATASGVLEESLDRYRNAVQGSYHRLKTVDNLFRFRGDILHRLDAIERESTTLEVAARWYAEHLAAPVSEATVAVAQDLRLIRMQFETLPEVTDDIDARNARFSGVALRKITYLLRHDRHIEGQLQVLIDAFGSGTAPEIDFNVYRCELLAPGFLYSPPKRRAPTQRQRLVKHHRNDRAALGKEIVTKLKQGFTRERVQKKVDEALGARRRASLAELPLAGDDDYVGLVYTVAFGLDGRSRYRFEPTRQPDGRRILVERRETYAHPAGSVVRTGKGKV